MQASKKNTYIFKENVKPMGESAKAFGTIEDGFEDGNLKDRMRHAFGKYWVLKPTKLYYGDPIQQELFENAAHTTISYGAVVERYLKNPPFCSKEQYICLHGDDAWGQPPTSKPGAAGWTAPGLDHDDFLRMVGSLAGNRDTGTGESGARSEIYKDCSFRIDTPFTQQERREIGDASALGYVDVDFNYNFYHPQYESALLNMREELLPPVYAFISDDISRNLFMLKTLQNRISQHLAQIRDTSPDEVGTAFGWSAGMLGHSTAHGTMDTYFYYLARVYGELTSKFKENFSVRFRNFIFPFENLELVSSPSKKSSFPMFVEVEFSTDSVTDIAQMLEDSSLTTAFQRNVAAGCGGTNASLLRQMGGGMDEYVSAKQNLSYSSSKGGSLDYSLGSYKRINLLTWWTNYLRGLVPKIYKNQTFIGPNTYSAYISSGVENNNLAQALSLLVFSGKLSGIVQKNHRSIEEVFEGKESHTETVLYRVAKYKGAATPGKIPIQNYWFPNSNNIDVVNLVDTQVKYNSVYTYVAYAYQLTIGTEYSYGPIEDTAELQIDCPELDISLNGMGCVTEYEDGSVSIDARCAGIDFQLVNNALTDQLGNDYTDIGILARDILVLYIVAGSVEVLSIAAYVSELCSYFAPLYDFSAPNLNEALMGAVWSYEAGESVSVTYPSVENMVYTDFTACTKVVTKPIVDVVEVPFFSHTGKMTDSPPLPPDVNIVPYRGESGKALIWLNSTVGDQEMYPIAFDQKEQQEINQIRQTNFLTSNDPIRFKSDDVATAFEIFRLAEKPEMYTDFAGNQRAVLSTMLETTSTPISKTVSSVSYVDVVVPNTKYYYTFRALDNHGHRSNPTAVYEIELVENGGAVYMITNIIPLEDKPKAHDPVKQVKRYVQIVPRMTQGLFNQEASGLADATSVLETGGNQYTLGVEDQSVWGKKYKVRFISKSTGRKIDLNLTYNKEHIITPEEEELRNLQTEPTYNWWDLFSSWFGS